jgi:hypothetical protein
VAEPGDIRPGALVAACDALSLSRSSSTRRFHDPASSMSIEPPITIANRAANIDRRYLERSRVIDNAKATPSSTSDNAVFAFIVA